MTASEHEVAKLLIASRMSEVDFYQFDHLTCSFIKEIL